MTCRLARCVVGCGTGARQGIERRGRTGAASGQQSIRTPERRHRLRAQRQVRRGAQSRVDIGDLRRQIGQCLGPTVAQDALALGPRPVQEVATPPRGIDLRRGTLPLCVIAHRGQQIQTRAAVIREADRDQSVLGRKRRVAEQGGSVRGCQAGRALAQQAEQTVAIRIQPWRAQGQGNRMRNRG